MSEIIFECSNCGAVLSTDESAEGWTVKCLECNHETPIPETGLFPGLQVGESFKLLELLRTSEMGEIWLAEQTFVDRKVMLKILPRALSQDSLLAKRFEREARNTSQLDHPNIIKWLDYGEENGKYFIATTYMNGGKTLREILANGERLSEGKALEITKKIAEALSYAWNTFKLLHRNIKPSNILVDESLEKIQLMNFGLSKMLSTDPTLTARGSLLGSPGYISPEQQKGQPELLDCRSDIYSLGAALYRMLAGRPPFEGETIGEILENQAQNNLFPIKKIAPGLSDDCSNLIKKMMAADQNERSQNWDEVLSEIKNILKISKKRTPRNPGAKSKKSAKPVSSLEKIARDSLGSSSKQVKNKKFPWTQLTIVSSIVMLTTGLGLFLFKQHEEYSNKKALEEKQKLEEQKRIRAQMKEKRKEEEKLRIKLRKERFKSAYEDAVKFSQKHLNNPPMLKIYFLKVKRFLKGSEYEKKFEKEYEKIFAQMEKMELKKRKQSVMYAIENAVAQLVEEKEYKQTALYYKNYSGEFAEETEAERLKKAMFYLALDKEARERLAKIKKAKISRNKAIMETAFGYSDEESKKTASSIKAEENSSHKKRRDTLIDCRKIKFEAEVKTDIENTMDGKCQKVFSKFLVKNKLNEPLENCTLSLHIICQSLANKKEFTVEKILSCEANLKTNSETVIENKALSFCCDKYTKSKKITPLKYEGYIAILKDPDGKILLINSSNSKIKRIEKKIISFEEGVFFTRKGKRIIL